MKNYFQGTEESPAHISVGAVLRNNAGEIACHYFDNFNLFKDFYLLMRETIEPNESIETCLMRGLQEEFGAVATLNRYVGSIVSHFPINDVMIQKTTLYFLCDLVSIEESSRAEGDPEAGSEIRWVNPEAIIPKLKEQGIRLGREDLDESSILERLVS